MPGQDYIRPQLWPFDPNFKPFSATPDLAQAKSKAAASGRAGDKIVITFGNTEVLNATATLIQAAAKAAGLNVELQGVDPASTTALLNSDAWDIVLSDTYTGSNSGLEPDAVNSLFRTKGSSNFGLYSNPEMDSEVDAAIFAPSHEAALPHYQRIMRIDADDIAVLTVVYHNYIEALSPKVKNYTSLPLAHYDLRNVQLG
jgi:ABC-type transport system substrate-binding protein